MILIKCCAKTVSSDVPSALVSVCARTMLAGAAKMRGGERGCGSPAP